MTKKLTGGCQCRHVRYEVLAAPETFYVCHCTQCRRQSASAFGLSLTVRRDATRIAGGPMKVWSRTGASGDRLDCHFCPECGVRLFHARSGAPQVWNIKAGTLDHPEQLAPVGHIWTQSALPWVRPLIEADGQSLKYEAQPPDKCALETAWRDKTENGER